MNWKKFITFTFAMLSACLILFSGTAGAAENGTSLVETRTTNFSLSSDRGRLVNYGHEYYGKHHLIVTFFPAAFTPV